MTWQEWRASRRQDASGLLGWGVMALLLSVGAPFWQDALESLFESRTSCAKNQTPRMLRKRKEVSPGRNRDRIQHEKRRRVNEHGVAKQVE